MLSCKQIVATMSGKKAVNLLKTIIEHSTVNVKGFETVLSKVRVVSGGDGTARCEMTVDEDHQNRGGTLHGGMTSTLVDAVSTWALLTSQEPVAGVSVDLSVSFMKAAKVGEDIIIDAKTLKRGNRLAFLTVDILNKADGSMIAQGKHTKYVG